MVLVPGVAQQILRSTWMSCVRVEFMSIPFTTVSIGLPGWSKCSRHDSTGTLVRIQDVGGTGKAFANRMRHCDQFAVSQPEPMVEVLDGVLEQQSCFLMSVVPDAVAVSSALW